MYVNPHLGLEYPRPYWFDRHTRFSKLAEGLLELHVHLPREHELSQRTLTPAESRRIAAEIEKLIKMAGIRTAALIVSFPAWLEVAESLGRVTDSRLSTIVTTGFRDSGASRLTFWNASRDLLQRADLVVFPPRI